MKSTNKLKNKFILNCSTQDYLTFHGNFQLIPLKREQTPLIASPETEKRETITLVSL